MADKKVERVITLDQPGMTQVVTKEYLQIWGTDVMIHRKFFAGFTVALWIIFQTIWGAVLGPRAVGEFYYTLLMMYVAFNLEHWVVIPIQILFVVAIIGVLYYRNRQYHAKHMSIQEQQRLAALRRRFNTDTVDTRGGDYTQNE